jgi:hypothetical protein
MTPNASTGPRSAEGRARSSRNALKSGIYSKSLIIPGEQQAQLDALTDEYFQRFCPAVPEQRDLVDILVRSTWTLRRLATAETQLFVFKMETVYKLSSTAPLGHAFDFCDRTLTRLHRIVNSTQRNYRDALREIERLQSLPINFDPPPAPAIEPVLPSESPTPSPQPPTPTPPQPPEPTPVNTHEEFVSSTFAPPPPAATKTVPAAPPKDLPYHKPGDSCRWSPADPVKYRNYKQCLRCYPNQVPSSDDQE